MEIREREMGRTTGCGKIPEERRKIPESLKKRTAGRLERMAR
jgi:hypothetical protein